MHSDKPGSQRLRSFARYSAVGGLLAVALELIRAAVRPLILGSPSGSAVEVLLIGCQCAISFQIGRFTAPKWYWGLSPIVAPLLGVIIAGPEVARQLALFSAEEGTRGAIRAVFDAAAPSLVIWVGLLTLAAFLGAKLSSGASSRRN